MINVLCRSRQVTFHGGLRFFPVRQIRFRMSLRFTDFILSIKSYLESHQLVSIKIIIFIILSSFCGSQYGLLHEKRNDRIPLNFWCARAQFSGTGSRESNSRNGIEIYEYVCIECCSLCSYVISPESLQNCKTVTISNLNCAKCEDIRAYLLQTLTILVLFRNKDTVSTNSLCENVLRFQTT